MACRVEESCIACTPYEARGESASSPLECSTRLAPGKDTTAAAGAVAKSAGTHFLCTAPVPLLRTTHRPVGETSGALAIPLAGELEGPW